MCSSGEGWTQRFFMMVRNPKENHLKCWYLSLAVFKGKSLDKNQAGSSPPGVYELPGSGHAVTFVVSVHTCARALGRLQSVTVAVLHSWLPQKAGEPWKSGESSPGALDSNKWLIHWNSWVRERTSILMPYIISGTRECVVWFLTFI